MMKIIQYALFLTLLIHTSCMGQQQIDTNLQNNNEMIEKLDFDFLDKYAKKTQDASDLIRYDLYKFPLEDGTVITIQGDKKTGFLEEQVPVLPAYWRLIKLYYPNGNIKEKVKVLYDIRIPIGIRQYFDSNGNLIKEEDCDKRYGRFSYEQVLKFLREKEHLGEDNAGIDNIFFSYNEKEKYWFVEVDLHDGNKYHSYKLDATTGEVLLDEIIIPEE